MNPVRALVCRSARADLLRTQLDREAILGMASSGLCRGIAVYVVPQDGLEVLASALPDGAMVNRGVKHRAKALSEYFARRIGLARVSAGYRHPGQAERGIRALLATAGAPTVSGRYFVGVPSPVFEALWTRSTEGPDECIRDHAWSFPDAARDALQELLALHPEIEIPDVVRGHFIGNSPAVRLVHYLVVLAAKCSHPVLIEGDTGTGKEVVARLIHGLQFGHDGKCVAVNCGGIPAELLESELFGHVRGAFTGATRNKIGLWQDAQDGTLFLDEVGDLSPTHQVKVLRALEEGEVRPVGALKSVASNARVLSATHRNLEDLVRRERFREDLYHRLVVLRIRTPSLREHAEDIPAIARHLWAGIRVRKEQSLPDEVCHLLEQLPLPGNVRELRSILSEMAMLAYGKPITTRVARMVLRGRGVGRQDG